MISVPKEVCATSGWNWRPHIRLARSSIAAATPADVEPTADGFRLVLDEPALAVAPGQVAVLYDDGAVVGAGVIVAAKG